MKVVEAISHLFDELDVSKQDAFNSCLLIVGSIAIENGVDLVHTFSDGTTITINVAQQAQEL
jgi:hypothetical protein